MWVTEANIWQIVKSQSTAWYRAKDASVSECTWILSALEALHNALYKFKTYLLTYLLTATLEFCSSLMNTVGNQ